MKKTYLAPNMSANKGALRCSILAGSNQNSYTPGNVVQNYTVNPTEQVDVQLARKRFGEF